jgi:hypothetical protein
VNRALQSRPKSFFFFLFFLFFLSCQKRLFFLFLFCFFFSFFSRPKTFFITVKLDRSLKKARSTVPPLASHFIHRPQMPPRGSPRKGTRSLEMINNTYIVLINSTLRLTGSLSFSFLSVLHPHIQPTSNCSRHSLTSTDARLVSNTADDDNDKSRRVVRKWTVEEDNLMMELVSVVVSVLSFFFFFFFRPTACLDLSTVTPLLFDIFFPHLRSKSMVPNIGVLLGIN